jgi:hypothetical protein
LASPPESRYNSPAIGSSSALHLPDYVNPRDLLLSNHQFGDRLKLRERDAHHLPSELRISTDQLADALGPREREDFKRLLVDHLHMSVETSGNEDEITQSMTDHLNILSVDEAEGDSMTGVELKKSSSVILNDVHGDVNNSSSDLSGDEEESGPNTGVIETKTSSSVSSDSSAEEDEDVAMAGVELKNSRIIETKTLSSISSDLSAEEDEDVAMAGVELKNSSSDSSGDEEGDEGEAVTEVDLKTSSPDSSGDEDESEAMTGVDLSRDGDEGEAMTGVDLRNSSPEDEDEGGVMTGVNLKSSSSDSSGDEDEGEAMTGDEDEGEAQAMARVEGEVEAQAMARVEGEVEGMTGVDLKNSSSDSLGDEGEDEGGPMTGVSESISLEKSSSESSSDEEEGGAMNVIESNEDSPPLALRRSSRIVNRIAHPCEPSVTPLKTSTMRKKQAFKKGDISLDVSAQITLWQKKPTEC